MGLRLQFKPDSLSIMQEDEEQRANSLKTLVDAGMSLEMALDILGYDLPEGIELREPKPEPPAVLPMPIAQPTPQPNGNGNGGDNQERIEETRRYLQERTDETGRFLRWARKRSSPDPEQFESVILSYEDKLKLLTKDALEGDADGDDAPFPTDWQGYP
jgi:hypothetical protein